MKQIIDKALRDWSCLTGINWTLGADTAFTGDSVLVDSLCIIKFSDKLDTSTLAQTSYRENLCSGKPMINEIDLVINKSKDWFCDTTGALVTFGQHDWYSVILHELGHGHGLGHVLDTAAVMYYASNPTVRKIDLEYDASCDEGGNWIIDNSTSAANFITCTNVQNISANPNPPCLHVGIVETKHQDWQYTVYPNPMTSVLKIDLESLNTIEQVHLQLFDLSGRLVKSAELSVQVGNNSFELPIEELTSGMYLLKLHSLKGELSIQTKCFKKQ